METTSELVNADWLKTYNNINDEMLWLFMKNDMTEHDMNKLPEHDRAKWQELYIMSVESIKQRRSSYKIKANDINQPTF